MASVDQEAVRRQACGAPDCPAPLHAVDITYTVCWRGHVTWLPDGTVAPYRMTYRFEFYDGSDRRVPWKLTRTPGAPGGYTLIPDGSPGAVTRAKRARRDRYRGGRHRIYPDEPSFVAAVHRLYAKADEQGWDLRLASIYTALRIGELLQPDLAESTLYDVLDDYGYTLRDLRYRRI